VPENSSFLIFNRKIVHLTLNYTTKFVIFPFTLEHAIAIVLLQKNQQGFGQPMAFINMTLWGKKYALVKSLISFRDYVLQSEIILYFPNPTVKEILIQHDCEGRLGKWVSRIQEYNIELKPTKIIKG